MWIIFRGWEKARSLPPDQPQGKEAGVGRAPDQQTGDTSKLRDGRSSFWMAGLSGNAELPVNPIYHRSRALESILSIAHRLVMEW